MMTRLNSRKSRESRKSPKSHKSSKSPKTHKSSKSPKSPKTHKSREPPDHKPRETPNRSRDEDRRRELLRRNVSPSKIASRTGLKDSWRRRHESDLGVLSTDVFRLIIMIILTDADMDTIKALRGVSKWFRDQLSNMCIGTPMYRVNLTQSHHEPIHQTSAHVIRAPRYITSSEFLCDEIHYDVFRRDLFTRQFCRTARIHMFCHHADNGDHITVIYKLLLFTPIPANMC